MGILSYQRVVCKYQRTLQAPGPAARLATSAEGVLGMDDVGWSVLKHRPKATAGIRNSERVSGSTGRHDRRQTMHVHFGISEAWVGRCDDVNIVAEPPQLTGEGGNRDNYAIDDRSVALGKEGDSHKCFRELEIYTSLLALMQPHCKL